MSQTITINLPDETKDVLGNAATEEGLSESALVERAVFRLSLHSAIP